MRSFLWSLLTALCALHVAHAHLLPRLLAETGPKPQDDPFYVAPSEKQLAEMKPGHIIRARPVKTVADASVTSSAYQLLYRTYDHAGRPTAAVTTTLVPRVKDAAGVAGAKLPVRLVAYESFTDSVALNCAGSYALTAGPSSPNFTPTFVGLGVINAFLAYGYTVTVPDFQGLNSEFIVGRTQARATLDGIRATLRHKPTIADPKGAKVGYIGYSGGASAAGWTAELAPEYAPEVDFVAATYGGLPVSPVSVLRHIDGTENAGLSLMGLLGLGNAYPEVEEYIFARANKKGKAAIKRLRGGSACLDAVKDYANTSLSDYFDNFSLDDELVQRINRENTLGANTPKVPLYIYQSTADEIIVASDVDKYVSSQCARGARILYSRVKGKKHNELLITGFPAAVDWLDKALTGSVTLPKPGECVIKQSASAPMPLSTPKAKPSGQRKGKESGQRKVKGSNQRKGKGSGHRKVKGSEHRKPKGSGKRKGKGSGKRDSEGDSGVKTAVDAYFAPLKDVPFNDLPDMARKNSEQGKRLAHT
ncbi:LIP-domain-containing protein [Ceraceosorus guamensis]|uniref:triacylglycerol lipase n=1 Tax=Ceraceosorus guamensis TaxID=1522189 RepID=A0A316W4M9_9BASI|nr:LIP-domain-containing protein [Ceraceosorus guamensis]PWN44830.1 LIP-domain-containing protein [Ceraceosorus guamensis]